MSFSSPINTAYPLEMWYPWNNQTDIPKFTHTGNPYFEAEQNMGNWMHGRNGPPAEEVRPQSWALSIPSTSDGISSGLSPWTQPHLRHELWDL